MKCVIYEMTVLKVGVEAKTRTLKAVYGLGLRVLVFAPVFQPLKVSKTGTSQPLKVLFRFEGLRVLLVMLLVTWKKRRQPDVSTPPSSAGDAVARSSGTPFSTSSSGASSVASQLDALHGVEEIHCAIGGRETATSGALP